MNFDFPMVKEKIAKAEKDFEKSKRDISKKLNNYKISHQDLSPLSGKIQEIFSVIDINTFDIDIKSKIISLLGDIDSKKNLIYNKVLEKIKKREIYLNQKLDVAKKSNHSEAIREINNELKNITMEKKSLDDSKKSIEYQTNLIETFCNDTNKTSQDLKKLNDSQSRRVAGGAAAAFVGSSVLGPEGAAILGGAYKLARTIGSKSARKEMFQNQGFGGIASKTVMGVGAYLGSPGIVGGGALMNEHFSKSRDVKNKSKSVLNSLNKITADKGMSGIAHGPTIAGLAMDGKPESFKFTPGKSSVNGVELNQSGSKGIVEELKRTNTLLDQNNDILKSLLGISKDTLEFEQDQANEAELKHKEGKKAEFKGFDTKTEKKKEEEDKKGFFANLKSSVIGFARSLMSSTGVGWAKLGGGIAGGALGAYGGFKAGKWASSKLGLEEGGTGEKIMEYGGAAAGLAGGAWAGSKLAGKIAGSKFFKKTGLGKLAGGLGGIASDQIARAEADQKVYVTNASEIGRACQGGGGIIDGAMDMLGGKGKIASKIFKGGIGRSATRLAAKIGGRGFAKTATSLAGKVGGKIPLIGGLIAGGATLASGGSKTEAAGSAAGSMAGAAIGTAILPGIGTIVGGMAGEWIGKKLGGLFNKQNKSEDELYKKETNLMKDKEDQQKSFFDQIKEKGLLGAVADKIHQTATEAKESYTEARKSGKSVVGAGWEAMKKVTGFGKVAAYFESGGNAGTVSSGKGDHGGKSYGTFQLASKTGTLQNFLRSSGYGSQFAGMQVGSKEFDAKWKALAKSDPNFAKAQQEFGVKTHFAPQTRKLSGAGIDLSKRGAGVQEAIMSTANQYGADTSVIIKALKGKDINKMSDADIINTIQDYKARTVNTRFRSSSAEVRAGVAKRIEQERKLLLAVNAEKSGAVPDMKSIAKEKPVAKEKPGKSKGYTDDSLTITQGPVEVGKHGIIASRTEKMPDGTERIYPIYGNPALGPTGAQVEKQIAKDRASILAKMKKGGKVQQTAAKPQGGTERVVEESKQTYTASEGAQLKRAEVEQEKAQVAAPTPAVINNVTNNSSRAGTPIPAIHITTGDRDSFPSRLARSY